VRARGIGVGREHADRLARLHQQGFVGFQCGEGLLDLVETLPVAGRAADRLDERCLAPKESLFVGIENTDELHFRQIQSLSQ